MGLFFHKLLITVVFCLIGVMITVEILLFTGGMRYGGKETQESVQQPERQLVK